MMDQVMPGMMWGMGLLWFLVVIVSILAAAGLIKYLRTGNKEGRQ
jgi:tellurite resistance protein TehA-like permease